MTNTKELTKLKISKDYLDRKQNAVIRDFESAQSWHQETLGRIYGGRGIVVALITAYTGFLFFVQAQNHAIVLPMIVIPIPFLLAEINERGHIHYLRSEIIKIENIFMSTDDNEFYAQIQAFTLRETRLSRDRAASKTWMRNHLIPGQLILDAFVWYIFNFSVMIAAFWYLIS